MNVPAPKVIIKKTWKKDEDEILNRLVEEFGSNENWTAIANKLGGRTGKQCRERYHNHLKAEIIKGHWSVEEDQLIGQLQKEYGNQWAKIAKFLPGRSDNAVKNRWHIRNRPKISGSSASSRKAKPVVKAVKQHPIVPALFLPTQPTTSSPKVPTLSLNFSAPSSSSSRSFDPVLSPLNTFSSTGGELFLSLSPLNTWRLVEEVLNGDMSPCTEEETSPYATANLSSISNRGYRGEEPYDEDKWVFNMTDSNDDMFLNTRSRFSPCSKEKGPEVESTVESTSFERDEDVLSVSSQEDNDTDVDECSSSSLFLDLNPESSRREGDDDDDERLDFECSLLSAPKSSSSFTSLSSLSSPFTGNLSLGGGSDRFKSIIQKLKLTPRNTPRSPGYNENSMKRIRKSHSLQSTPR